MNSFRAFWSEVQQSWGLFAAEGNWLRQLGRFFPPVLIILIFAALGLSAQIFGWSGPKEGLLWVDMHFSFWILLGIFASMVSLLVYQWGDLIRHFKANKPSWTYVLLVVVLASLATTFAGGKTRDLQTGAMEDRIAAMHRVQSDEAIFLNVAQNMSARHMAATCEEALMDKGMQCIPGAKGHTDVDHFKLKSMSLLLTVLMPVLGNNLQWIYGFQLALFFFTLCAFSLVFWIWTREAFLSLAALSLMAWAPLVLFQFRSFSVEPLYLALAALVLLFYHYALRSRTPKVLAKWALLAVAIGFWLHTRQETFMTLPALLLFALPAMQRDSSRIEVPNRFKNPWLKWAYDPISLWSALVGLSFVPVYCLVVSYWGYDFQGGEFKPHGHFWENLGMLWQQMTLPHSREAVPDVMASSWNQMLVEWSKVDESVLLTTPFLSTHAWLALFGIPALAWMAWKDSKVLRWIAFALLFQLQTYMILENVSGDLSIEINQRYALVWLPFQALLGAAALRVLLVDLLPKLFPRVRGEAHDSFHVRKDSLLLALIVMLVLTALTWRHQNSFVQNIMYSNNHLTNEEKMIHDFLGTMPKKQRLFIYNRSLHFVAYGISSLKLETWMQMDLADKAKMLERFDGEVYYVRGLDCAENQNNHGKAAGQDASGICEAFEQSNGLEKVYESTVLGTYPLVIAKLNDRAPAQFGLLGIRPAASGGMELGVNVGQCAPGSIVRIAINGSEPVQAPCSPGVMTVAIPALPSAVIDVQADLVGADGAVLSARAKSLNPSPAQVPLSLEPQNIRQSWYKPALGTNVMGKPLRVNGIQYFFGWGTHADSHLEFVLGGGYKTFKSLVGLDDDEMGGDGALFRVLGDGKVLWESNIASHQKLDSFEVNVSGVQMLTLETQKNMNDEFDHTNWLLPVLTK